MTECGIFFEKKKEIRRSRKSVPQNVEVMRRSFLTIVLPSTAVMGVMKRSSGSVFTADFHIFGQAIRDLPYKDYTGCVSKRTSKIPPFLDRV